MLKRVLSAAQKEKMIADQNVVDKTALVNDAKSKFRFKGKRFWPNQIRV